MSPGGSISGNGSNKLGGSIESADDFTHRIFGGFGDSSSEADPFYQKLDRLEKTRGKTSFGPRRNSGDSSVFQNLDDVEIFDTLSDEMDGKLKKAAMSYPYNDEIKSDDYAFRPDVSFRQGMTYTIKVCIHEHYVSFHFQLYIITAFKVYVLFKVQTMTLAKV